ncbi:MAG: hypothetical protein AB8H79_06910 [Myxococcota bacterium]
MRWMLWVGVVACTGQTPSTPSQQAPVDAIDAPTSSALPPMPEVPVSEIGDIDPGVRLALTELVNVRVHTLIAPPEKGSEACHIVEAPDGLWVFDPPRDAGVLAALHAYQAKLGKSVTWSTDHSQDHGGVTPEGVRRMAFLGADGDDVDVFWWEAEKAWFTGALTAKDVPILADPEVTADPAHTKAWLASVQALEDRKPDAVFSGRGKPGDGRVIRSTVAKLRALLEQP